MPNYEDYGSIEDFVPEMSSPDYGWARPGPGQIITFIIIAVIILLLVFSFLQPISSMVNEVTNDSNPLAQGLPFAVPMLRMVTGVLVIGVFILIVKGIWGKRRV